MKQKKTISYLSTNGPASEDSIAEHQHGGHVGLEAFCRGGDRRHVHVMVTAVQDHVVNQA